MKDELSQAKQEYERALSAKSQEMLTILNTNRDRFHTNPAWQELYYAHPVAKYSAKLSKLLSDFQAAHPLTPTEKLTMLVALAVERGSAVLQAQANKAAQPKRGQGKAKAAVNAPERIENDEVVAAVTQVANGFKVQVKAQFVAYYRNGIESWQKKCAENPGKTDPSTFWPYASNVGVFVYMMNQTMRRLLSNFLDSEPRPSSEWINESPRDREQLRYTLKADYEAIIERKAERDAEEAIQSFIGKMTRKLKGILDQKGDFKQVIVDGNLGSNSMVFLFDDRSCFTVTNDIITNHSIYGLPFNQYPTRFTRVKLRPATQAPHLDGISEAWMKKNFK